MPEFLFSLHSGVRYLVLLAGVVTAILALRAGRGPVRPVVRRAWRTFLGLLDLQVLAGLAVLATRPFQGAYIGHFVMMLAALAVGHGVGIAFRRRPAEARTGGLLAVGAVAALALIAGGILAIGRSIV